MSSSPPSLPLVDLVVLADTSPSVKDDARAISAAAEAAMVSAHEHCPADLRVVWLGLEGRWRGTEFNQTLRGYLTEHCGVEATQLRSRQRGELESAGAQEDAARAIEDAANHFPWRENAQRALFYFGDEALDAGGDRTEAADIEAANRAIQQAKAARVRVHTYFGSSKSEHRDSIAQEYARVAAETNGQFFRADNETPTDFVRVLEQIICSSQTPSPSAETTMPSKKVTTQANGEPPTKAPAPQQTPPSEVQKSYIPTTMTGLQDYAYWWAYAREHAKTAEPNSKGFRRGRIWD